jgi:uncharacterized protein YbjT (DUF2867 family)
MKRWIAAFAVLASGIATSAWAENVLVFGGSGRMGAEFVKVLRAAGHDVTVFVRPSSDRGLVADQGVAFVEGDVMKAEDVTRAMSGRVFATVVNALGGRNNQGSFYDTSQYNITAAAKATGVKQVIFISSLGAGESRKVYPDNRWKIFSEVLMQKDRAEKNLMASGVGYTIVRNDQIMAYETPPTGTARLTEDQTAMGPITRADLAAVVGPCVGASRCMNKIFHAVDTIAYVPEPQPAKD